MHKNKTIDGVICNDEKVMQHFHEIFPEVEKSNYTGKLNTDSFALWNNKMNNINIELDLSKNRKVEETFDVYIGKSNILLEILPLDAMAEIFVLKVNPK